MFKKVKPNRSVASKQPILPDRFDRLLSGLAIFLMLAILVAVIRGQDQWEKIPWQIWTHLATISVALMITPVMLWRKRGDRVHRYMGWVWSAAMVATALISLDIRQINAGGFSFIHILSGWTLVLVPLLIWEARHHKVAAHRSTVRGLITGALLIAGFFTFPFNRLLGHWLFG
tara:strand:- start:9236 stop:9754 length:519 start_codon:yes stop_codon:yes gene_type:complete